MPQPQATIQTFIDKITAFFNQNDSTQDVAIQNMPNFNETVAAFQGRSQPKEAAERWINQLNNLNKEMLKILEIIDIQPDMLTQTRNAITSRSIETGLAQQVLRAIMNYSIETDASIPNSMAYANTHFDRNTCTIILGDTPTLTLDRARDQEGYYDTIYNLLLDQPTREDHRKQSLSVSIIKFQLGALLSNLIGPLEIESLDDLLTNTLPGIMLLREATISVQQSRASSTVEEETIDPAKMTKEIDRKIRTVQLLLHWIEPIAKCTDTPHFNLDQASVLMLPQSTNLSSEQAKGMIESIGEVLRQIEKDLYNLAMVDYLNQQNPGLAEAYQNWTQDTLAHITLRQNSETPENHHQRLQSKLNLERALQSVKTKNKDLRRTLQAVKTKNQELQIRQAEDTRTMNSLRDENTNLNTQQAENARTMNSLRDENTNLKTQQAEDARTMNRLRDENTNLKTQKDQRESDLKNIQRKVQGLEKQKADANSQLNNYFIEKNHIAKNVLLDGENLVDMCKKYAKKMNHFGIMAGIAFAALGCCITLSCNAFPMLGLAVIGIGIVLAVSACFDQLFTNHVNFRIEQQFSPHNKRDFLNPGSVRTRSTYAELPRHSVCLNRHH